MDDPDLTAAQLRHGFDPERFRRDGHRLIDALADQLGRWHEREGPVVPWASPEAARARWASTLEGTPPGGEDPVTDLVAAVAASTALAHPRCLGHQVPPPVPVAVLAETASALINNGMAVAEMGPAATPIELAVVRWMARALGMGASSGGVLTSGGSVGNLTALLAMRQARAGFDAWHGGAHAGAPLAVIVSGDAHYSIARALRIMGWGDGGAIRAELDAHHRMTAAAAERALAEAAAHGRRVIGIVAAAGSTAVGAYDPLGELADVAERHGLWLHVDAAHGGGVALSPTLRGKLAGIDRADSITWDAHKLLMMPALVTGVLFRREPEVYSAFAQRASYLFASAPPDETWWDLGQRTLECTKRAMALELWVALRSLGEAWFGQVIDRLHQLARALAARVTAAPDFELALEPESNIVCYRHVADAVDLDARHPARVEYLDAHNRALRQRVVEDGRFYIVGTQLPRGYFLRSTLMNPLTEPADLDDLLAHLRALCR